MNFCIEGSGRRLFCHAADRNDDFGAMGSRWIAGFRMRSASFFRASISRVTAGARAASWFLRLSSPGGMPLSRSSACISPEIIILDRSFQEPSKTASTSSSKYTDACCHPARTESVSVATCFRLALYHSRNQCALRWRFSHCVSGAPSR